MGHDEEMKDPSKPLRVLRHLREKCLADNGALLVTIPVGYNPTLDQAVSSGTVEGYGVKFLKRTSKTNSWNEVDYSEVKGARYDSPYSFANAIAVIGNV
jgi:hypothetical protein